MRLIDADAFKKQIAGMAIVNNYSAAKANKMCELIDCQPTVYDVDKVVERLEKRYMEMIDGKRKLSISDFCEYTIDLIKSGGNE